jgi:hypothetical protein
MGSLFLCSHLGSFSCRQGNLALSFLIRKSSGLRVYPRDRVTSQKGKRRGCVLHTITMEGYVELTKRGLRNQVGFLEKKLHLLPSPDRSDGVLHESATRRVVDHSGGSVALGSSLHSRTSVASGAELPQNTQGKRLHFLPNLTSLLLSPPIGIFPVGEIPNPKF